MLLKVVYKLFIETVNDLREYAINFNVYSTLMGSYEEEVTEYAKDNGIEIRTDDDKFEVFRKIIEDKGALPDIAEELACIVLDSSDILDVYDVRHDDITEIHLCSVNANTEDDVIKFIKKNKQHITSDTLNKVFEELL